MPADTPAAASPIKPITIGPGGKPQLPLAFGGSWFIPYGQPSAEDAGRLAAMEAVYEAGVRHFDTGASYGSGHSEELYGKFVKGRRDGIFLASKADPAETTAEAMLAAVEGSLKRLGVDSIDLYYIHWPRPGRDMRPAMDGLERARRQGKIGAAGVSNFSVAQMQQVAEVGTIDAHQLGYNLIWRHPEDEVIPYCAAHGIAVVCYSSLAHGILTGKFNRMLDFPENDQRHRVLPFRADIWPYVYEGVERLKAIAAETGRPLAHLAIRWLLAQRGVTSVIIGAGNRAQAEANAGALDGTFPADVFARMTAISDEIKPHVPDLGNVFGHP